MYTLKGFFNYAPFVNNNPDTVAMFGELSANSNTYGKDKSYFTDVSTPFSTLTAFHSKSDGTVTPVDSLLAVRILQLGYYLVQRAISGNITDDATALIQSVLAEYAGVVDTFAVGEMLTNGSLYLPEWIRVKFNSSVITEDNAITIWFADDSFQRQYDEYIIEVVVPLIPLDQFFLDPLQVQSLLNQYDLVDKLEEVQALRGDYPYTILSPQRYDYRDPNNIAFQLPTHWLVLIYGQAGNNPDAIKNALIDYILANSVHSRSDWTQILPDLFITTEFVFTPFWNSYAIPNRTLQAGIYSPILKPVDIVAWLLQTTKGPMYTEAWIEANYQVSANLYRSIAFAVIGNPDNRDGLTELTDVFPDYILVTNDSSDFNRVEPYTQEWMVKFSQLILIAETMTANTSVPVGYARIIRDNVVYASVSYDNITFMVVAKPQFE